MKNITFENYKKYVGKKVEVDIYCYAAGIMYPEDNILIGMNPGTYYFYSQEDDHYWHWDVVDGKGGSKEVKTRIEIPKIESDKVKKINENKDPQKKQD
jgi:hypothetical protein